MADDLKIKLLVVKEGATATFELNGKNFGTLERGDKVAIAKDRSVTVNGTARTAGENPPK